MSLFTGKRIHSYHWKELAISKEIIERVEYLAEQEGQPLLKDKHPFFEWRPGVEMMDGESEGEYVGMIKIDKDAPRENKIINIHDAQFPSQRTMRLPSTFSLDSSFRSAVTVSYQAFFESTEGTGLG